MVERVALDEANIIQVITNPVGYKGCCFVIDGHKVHDGRKAFTVVVECLLAESRRMPFSVTVEFLEFATRRIRDMIE